MGNPNYFRNKEANKDATRRSVKTSLKNAFTDQNLAGMIERSVRLSTPIQQQAHLLANLHALRLCENGIAMPAIDETFWNRCYSAVSEAICPSAKFKRGADAELTTSLDQFNSHCLPAGHVKPQRPAFIKDVSRLTTLVVP